jgi:hypothetical protein
MEVTEVYHVLGRLEEGQAQLKEQMVRLEERNNQRFDRIEGQYNQRFDRGPIQPAVRPH